MYLVREDACVRVFPFTAQHGQDVQGREIREPVVDKRFYYDNA